MKYLLGLINLILLLFSTILVANPLVTAQLHLEVDNNTESNFEVRFLGQTGANNYSTSFDVNANTQRGHTIIYAAWIDGMKSYTDHITLWNLSLASNQPDCNIQLVTRPTVEAFRPSRLYEEAHVIRGSDICSIELDDNSVVIIINKGSY